MKYPTYPRGMLRAYCQGFRDALRPGAFIYCFTSDLIRKRFLQCFFLNGILFMGSVFVMYNMIYPILDFFLSICGFSDDILEWTKFTVDKLYKAIWVLPLYMLSFVINSLWYQDIAEQAHSIYHKSRAQQIQNRIKMEQQRRQQQEGGGGGGGKQSYITYLNKQLQQHDQYMDALQLKELTTAMTKENNNNNNNEEQEREEEEEEEAGEEEGEKYNENYSNHYNHSLSSNSDNNNNNNNNNNNTHRKGNKKKIINNKSNSNNNHHHNNHNNNNNNNNSNSNNHHKNSKNSKKKIQTNYINELRNRINEEIYHCLFLIVFNIQIILLSNLGSIISLGIDFLHIKSYVAMDILAKLCEYTGFISAFLLFCWQHAFLSFEYRWIFAKIPLSQRIRYFEERIPYFSGFGTPLTILVLTTPHFIGTGIYMLIFPLFIIQAIESTPITHRDASKRYLTLLSSWNRDKSTEEKKNQIVTNNNNEEKFNKNTKEILTRIKIFAFTEWLQYILVMFCGNYFCVIRLWLKGFQFIGKIIGL